MLKALQNLPCIFDLACTKTLLMDLFPNEQNFDLDKSRQIFHHSLKEHHKISK
jgi:hypothetical protein